MSRIGQYKHISVDMPLNLDGIAERLVETNYGVHNMLSAIVVAYRRKHPERFTDPKQRYDWDIVLKVEAYLNKGDF